MNENNTTNTNGNLILDILRKYILPIFSMAAIVGLDQWTKYLILLWAEKDPDGFGKSGYYIIEKVLRLFFVKNEGMAWGLMQNKQIVFIIITPIVVAGLLYFYYKMPFTKKYSLMRVCVLFLAGGAIGNLIDRVFRGELFHGYVVDMIYVEIINFPVFNIADSFITVGFAVLIFSILFVYKEKDFDIIFKKKSADSIEESENIEETNENTADENAENKEADANAGNEEKSETDNVEEIIDESKEEKNSEETEKAESDDNKEET